MFLEFWRQGRLAYDKKHGIDRERVASANLNDFKQGRATIESMPIGRPKPRRKLQQGLCLDRGYDYTEVRDLCKKFGFTAHIRSRGDEAQALKREAGFRARRWVVERTHSWLNSENAIGCFAGV